MDGFCWENLDALVDKDMEDIEELEALKNISLSAATLIKHISREYGVYEPEGFHCPHIRQLTKNLMPFHKDLLPKRPDPPPPEKPGPPGPKG